MAKFTCIVCCRDCGHFLAEANDVPTNEYLRIVMSAPLVTPRCPKGCRATFSDCNLNSELDWFEQIEGKLIPVGAEYVATHTEKVDA